VTLTTEVLTTDVRPGRYGAPVPRPVRPVPAVVAALCALVLAGCGAADLAKQNPFPRSTIAANAENATDTVDVPTNQTAAPAGQPVDPAFAVDKVRLMDPCKLFDDAVLKQLGTPDDYLPGGFSRCSNYMKNKEGKDLSITLEIGQTMTIELQKADKKLAGLRSYEQTVEGACFVSVITQDSPGLGITVQIGLKEGDACEPGRVVAESVVKQAKLKSSSKAAEKGSLITLDPCVLPEQSAITEAAGSSPKVYPYGLHNCTWVGKDAEMSVDLRSTFIPDDEEFDPKQTTIDLAGTKAYQVEAKGAYPSCTIKWVHRKTDKNEGEIVEVKSSGAKASDFDRCAKAQAFGKALLPKVPH
jgi:hypothetical protein